MLKICRTTIDILLTLIYNKTNKYDRRRKVSLYPKFYLKSVKKIDIDLLKKNSIKGLILDVDNTLIDIDKKLLDGVEEWCKNLRGQGVKICILSNTSHKEKAQGVAAKLEIPFIHFAKKPCKKGFYKAQKLLEIEKTEEIAVVGDQLFTDILGANRVGMIPILVEPVDKRDLWYTKIKRPLENMFIRKFVKKMEEK